MMHKARGERRQGEYAAGYAVATILGRVVIGAEDAAIWRGDRASNQQGAPRNESISGNPQSTFILFNAGNNV